MQSVCIDTMAVSNSGYSTIYASDNMAQKEHIGLICNSMGCCSIWN